MRTTFLLALFCLPFAACNTEIPPVESCLLGNVAPSGDLVDKMELSPAQLQSLSAWLRALSGDWKFQVTDNYPSGLLLVLNHKNGRTTRVNLRGDQLWIGNRVRVLTRAEREELLALVSAKNQLPVFGK